MSSVVATRPATSIRELAPNRMPFELSSMIWPFAVSVPRMAELVEPVTRFSVIELDDGWMKLVVSSSLIEKLFQLMIALSVD